ncbi:hypothetical protein ACOMHN_015252 [Nucella lapillus]
MNWKQNLGLFVLLLMYILVGALVFCALEYRESAPPDITQMDFFREFLANHSSVPEDHLGQFSRRVVQACQQAGGAVVGNVSQQGNGWTYDNAVYFTITVVSTIGFGHITPQTAGGKVFCMLFAIVGIPMAVALLASVGTHLRRPIDWLHRARPWYPGNPVRDKRLKSAVVLTVGTVLMLCAPSLLFSYTEGWDYLTALYYSTITLTTIGFGDYVAGLNYESPWLRIVMSLWLALGLAYVAMVISEASDLYSGSQGEKEDPDKIKEMSERHDCEQQNGRRRDDTPAETPAA